MKPTSIAGMAPLVILAALSSPALAQAETVYLLERLDSDGDNIVSRNEVVAARERLFDRLDLNGDGSVDGDEIEALREGIMNRATAAQARLGNLAFRVDSDSDGAISREEFQGRNILFQLTDRDADGRLSADELAFVRELLGFRS